MAYLKGQAMISPLHLVLANGFLGFYQRISTQNRATTSEAPVDEG
jgi:hypothetical protein